MVYLLFIEQDMSTDFYITESHTIYAFSSLFIMIIIYHKKVCQNLSESEHCASWNQAAGEKPVFPLLGLAPTV